MRKRGIAIAVTATAFMSLAAPAYAVTTDDECIEDLEGQVAGEGLTQVCVFPIADPEECEADYEGVLTRDEEECIVFIE